MHAFAAHGFELAGLTSDTALAAYLALPGQRTFDLADLALRYLGKELREEAEMPASSRWTARASETRRPPWRCAPRRRWSWPTRWMRTWTGAVAAAAARRRAAAGRRPGQDGAHRDRRRHRPLRRRCRRPCTARRRRPSRPRIAVAGHEFNLGSPKQLQEVLFNELGLPKTKRIKTGYTTDSEALTGLLAQTGHPVLEHLLRHRDVAKLMSIVDSLIPMAGEDGRIHTTFNQTVAATGRLSSTDPNLQNIPIRSELGRQIRRGLRGRRGLRDAAVADYSQIELRIMAHLSGDEALIAAFESGHDFHAATASRVFGLPPADSGTRAAGQDQGDELRAGLRPVRLRAFPAAADHARRGARADGGVFQGVRRRPGLPARVWSRGPGWTATPPP